MRRGSYLAERVKVGSLHVSLLLSAAYPINSDVAASRAAATLGHGQWMAYKAKL